MRTLTTSLLSVLTLFALAQRTDACPNCDPSGRPTLREELAKLDVVLVARLERDVDTVKEGKPAVRVRFVIQKVLKGEKFLGGEKAIETLFFGEARAGQDFLLKGTDAPHVAWALPIPLTPRAVEYLAKIPTLPASGERLKFYNDHLEDADELLAADAYDEFAIAPYSEITAMKSQLRRDKLVAWIQETKPETERRRRLYLMLLALVGTQDDLPMLEEMIRSKSPKRKSGLDAVISCYLSLRGPAGLALIEELFLKNTKADYVDTFDSLKALRFHGTDANVLPKERVVQAMRTMLDRPALADLVVPDLARWEDWTAMPRLVELFKKSQPNDLIRVSAINYLRACPLPEAKVHLAELKKLDPEAFDRAESFFPFGRATLEKPVEPAKGE